MRVPVQYLGQSGWKMSFPDVIIYVDPYLSNSVQELDAPDLVRLKDIPCRPEDVIDANFVLITHDHIDHCDPHTLPKIAEASPNAKFLGPTTVIKKLAEWGIDSGRLFVCQERIAVRLSETLSVTAVPAAHLNVERDGDGRLLFVGYILDFSNKKIYIAGDTCLNEQVIEAVARHLPIHTAILPVNEHNYYRAKRGIVGNMSIREAIGFANDLNAKYLVAVHWDMFAVNSAFREEIELVHRLVSPKTKLLIDPKYLNFGNTDISVVIRTLNEEKYLGELISSIRSQDLGDISTEIIIVDSGSTDKTLHIAYENGCHVEHISKKDFSFGRSLNIGCRVAAGETIVIISGHCVPLHRNWLKALCEPISAGLVQYAYGRQVAGPESHFSEHRIFSKYFPMTSAVPQHGFFCNNANSAIQREAWERHLFDEEVTGLEDMELANRLVASGGKVGYIAEAAVFHFHSESWPQVRRRFEREAIALRKIMPHLHVSVLDAARYIVTSVYKDYVAAKSEKGMKRDFMDILLYRWNQYLGGWIGNQEHRKISFEDKEKYFYPT